MLIFDEYQHLESLVLDAILQHVGYVSSHQCRCAKFLNGDSTPAVLKG